LELIPPKQGIDYKFAGQGETAGSGWNFKLVRYLQTKKENYSHAKEEQGART